MHWQTAATYYQAQAGYKREYPYGYDYPGRYYVLISFTVIKNVLYINSEINSLTTVTSVTSVPLNGKQRDLVRDAVFLFSHDRIISSENVTLYPHCLGSRVAHMETRGLIQNFPYIRMYKK